MRDGSLPSDSTLLSSGALTCLFGDEPRMRTNSLAIFRRAGNEAHRFNFVLFICGCLLRFTSVCEADRCTLFVPSPSICCSASFSELDASLASSPSSSSCSDDCDDPSVICGLERLPYFLLPITNLGATSRVGEMHLDILLRCDDTRSKATVISIRRF